MAATQIVTATNLFPLASGQYGLEVPPPVDNVERIVNGILSIFARLESLEVIDADPDNIKLYRSLFELLTKTKTTAIEDEMILNDPRVLAIGPDLWDIWGRAEYIVERDFAKTVIEGTSKSACLETLNSYTSLARYRQIARMEVNTIDTALGEYNLPPVRKMALLGSGPMPYTSLCFQERYGPSVSFLNIDRNPEAIELGSQVVERCGFKNITFHEADVASLEALSDYDVVHFAALIGATPEQRRDLIIAVAGCMRPGAMLLVRSTDSLRTLLYPRVEIDVQEIKEVVTPVVATRYYGGATSLSINVLRVDGHGAPAEFVPPAHL